MKAKYRGIIIAPKDLVQLCEEVNLGEFFEGMKASERKDWTEFLLERERKHRKDFELRIILLETRMEDMERDLRQYKEERKNMILIDMPDISDQEAEEQIKNYLYSIKDREVKKVGLLDIMVELNLPPQQIERIMKGLEKEGVKEIE